MRFADLYLADQAAPAFERWLVACRQIQSEAWMKNLEDRRKGRGRVEQVERRSRGHGRPQEAGRRRERKGEEQQFRRKFKKKEGQETEEKEEGGGQERKKRGNAKKIQGSKEVSVAFGSYQVRRKVVKKAKKIVKKEGKKVFLKLKQEQQQLQRWGAFGLRAVGSKLFGFSRRALEQT